ncbi:MAG: Holliday junction branch migration protein RuvA [Ruminococcaceae bacterium]|nr:Holliday junction branch migration protein RuvA [Oscillospiraceae bacterium]
MFYYIKGKLVKLATDFAAVDCGGVCYKLWVSGSTYGDLAPNFGKEVLLYTHLNVREDVMELYGFSTEEELGLFKLLIGVSGVGPKAAGAILTGLTVESLTAAVNAGDAKAISRAQGVGLKTAQKIILELSGKLATVEGSDISAPVTGTADADAMDALTVLGFRRDEAAAALKGLPASLSLEEKIGEALKRLNRI